METNPFLKNITDFLIEEVSAEEEELIGASGGNEEDKDPSSSSEVAVETDDKLVTVCVCVFLLEGCLQPTIVLLYTG